MSADAATCLQNVREYVEVSDRILWRVGWADFGVVCFTKMRSAKRSVKYFYFSVVCTHTQTMTHYFKKPCLLVTGSKSELV